MHLLSPFSLNLPLYEHKTPLVNPERKKVQRKFTYQCQTTLVNLNAHQKRHLDMKVKCDICGRIFKNKANRLKHMKRHQ